MLKDAARDGDDLPCGALVQIVDAVFKDNSWKYIIVRRGRPGIQWHAEEIAEAELRKPKYQIGEEGGIKYEGGEHFGFIKDIKVHVQQFFYDIQAHMMTVSEDFVY